MTPTRDDYMNNRVSFHDFYLAVAKTAGLTPKVIGPELLERVRRSKDEHLNDIPMPVWDNLGHRFGHGRLNTAFKAHGDFFSLAGGVCLFKTLAREALKADEADYDPQPFDPGSLNRDL